MKKVWVNRFDVDGTFKLISEWEHLDVKGNENLAVRCRDGWHGHFSEKALAFKKACEPHLPVANADLIEYIGDQRGDGWFYVADGDLPPNSDEVVLAWGLDACKSATVKARTVIHQYERSKKIGSSAYPCWQPIQQPKFLD